MKSLKAISIIMLFCAFINSLLSFAYPHFWTWTTKASLGYMDMDLYSDELAGLGIMYMGIILCASVLFAIIYFIIALILNKTSRMNDLSLNTASICAILYCICFIGLGIGYCFIGFVWFAEGDDLDFNLDYLYFLGDISITSINICGTIVSFLALYVIKHKSKILTTG